MKDPKKKELKVVDKNFLSRKKHIFINMLFYLLTLVPILPPNI